ncbi:PIN2/TERF1-interacting telomerase inhibitor 1 isoform X2 [Betta splendens]|uniref:PIN2/TERF1-interacting telomerase inhibitor 1 isoform X2 n=1 Tax=Betta splendens TaxID=158456 RepID=A0A6P7LSH7_BETSP|nr:PIN2/TERF1-interacting telomerase inhibitor 1 isoform X2 [Betta splendens]
MSMLAEPRRKQKWSIDPRNSAWSNDDSKFGQKMLERMGWSKGKGLGRSEQGSTDHIKVKVKNDNYGLGANASYEDNWIAHQDDFNDLLAQLNNHHGQNSNEPPEDELKGFSLEEKSKSSRKRVHYMKFTKGKDLSSRSESDLNCIFGKRAKSVKDREQESSSSDSQGETEVSASAGAELDAESITKTVTSTLSVKEYFAQRMAQLKKARGQVEDSGPIHSCNGDTEEPRKKKKKKKRSKKAEDEVDAEESCSNLTVVEGEDIQEMEGPRKKKRRKTIESETSENCGFNPDVAVEQSCEEQPPPKKKKNKKHCKDTELLNGHEAADDQPLNVLKDGKEKKKKRREEVDSVVEEQQVQNKSRKKKSKL